MDYFVINNYFDFCNAFINAASKPALKYYKSIIKNVASKYSDTESILKLISITWDLKLVETITKIEPEDKEQLEICLDGIKKVLSLEKSIQAGLAKLLPEYEKLCFKYSGNSNCLLRSFFPEFIYQLPKEVSSNTYLQVVNTNKLNIADEPIKLDPQLQEDISLLIGYSLL